MEFYSCLENLTAEYAGCIMINVNLELDGLFLNREEQYRKVDCKCNLRNI